jgi:hypothetical protein
VHGVLKDRGSLDEILPMKEAMNPSFSFSDCCVRHEGLSERGV